MRALKRVRAPLEENCASPSCGHMTASRNGMADLVIMAVPSVIGEVMYAKKCKALDAGVLDPAFPRILHKLLPAGSLIQEHAVAKSTATTAVASDKKMVHGAGLKVLTQQQAFVNINPDILFIEAAKTSPS